MRTGRSSKTVSAVAILGLILVSSVMAFFLNTVSLLTVFPKRGTSQGSIVYQNSGQYGELMVQLLSNGNGSNPYQSPLSLPYPVTNQTVVVQQNVNSSTPFSEGLVTVYPGTATTDLNPGSYFVKVNYQTLKVSIPVLITDGNATDLTVTFNETAYPLVYSEESGLALSVAGVRESMYVELDTTSPAARVSQPVILNVDYSADSGYRVNATVIAGKPPSQGTQWLELETGQGWGDTVDATSLVLTTWSYSSSTSFYPI